ncbi:DsbC family protein [Niveibacterium umoris]|uniref:Thiol:disulfide interchange protein n=1 Tax=Niveibacterium umoris TaxID=1193620 RepID=A0A840BMF1_9RHOO|nr:DsbC family protein [Niveibacterium umoris]MBB4012832.1 thiol:disulfide interchange protein DsbC [Niveibacterium umoris]
MKFALSAVALAAAFCSTAYAGEAEIRKAVAEFVGQEAVLSITRTNYGGLYEVVMDSGELVYTDDQGSFILDGQLIDLKRKVNVTSERQAALNKVNIGDLPLDQAIKTVRGNGKRTLVTFEDPNCGYCKKFVSEAQQLKDVTIYTFLYPILSPDSTEKSKAIWCAKDRAVTWRDWMIDGKLAKGAECSTPIDKNVALGRKLRINGTPTMFLADGSRVGGFLPLPKLEEAIAQAEKNKPARSK